ncbi:MAG TPA: hypothetical protein VFW34_11360 [Candidatus Rubrimentiphilum sp.]|nr:hypothetical protein [Candidatus Rubrimentiphilum sp.]
MRWLPAAVVALALFVIGPALASGWVADDAFYSALTGVLGADRLSLWQAMGHSFHVWFFGNGRFYPGLILEKYVVFDLFTNLVAYKVFLAAATLAALEMFRRCVKAYTTPAFAGLCALVAAALLLIHGYQDALIAYNAMPQVVAIALFASFIVFRAALVRNERGMMCVAFGLYALAALIYEDVYLLCAIYPFLARPLTGGRRAALRASAPFIGIAVALGLFELALHGWVKLPPDALYAINADPLPVLRTAFYQITAALPFTYWLADPPRSFPVFALGAFIASAAVGWFALRAVARSAPKRLPVATGILAAILPAIPVALLVKYQLELRLGIGYLPVFLQTFGVALLLASAATAAARTRFGGGARIAAAFVLGILAAGAYASNVQLVRAQEPARAARASFEAGIAHGLLSQVPDGSTVTIPKSFDWIDYDDSGPDGISTRGLLYRYAGKRADLEAPGDVRARFALIYAGPAGAWKLRALSRVPQTGLPRPCNGSEIVNGDFTFGFRCWAQVATARGRFYGLPQFWIGAAGECLPALSAGNPFAALDVSGGAAGYIAQTFRYRGTPTTITLKAWSLSDPVNVQAGIVYPVGVGVGAERIIGTFVAPSLNRGRGGCSGFAPIEKTLRFSGYARGTQIQLRLHATAVGSDGAAAFDDVTSKP